MLRKSRRSERRKRKRKREGHIRHNSSLKPEKESSVPVCLHVSVRDSVCVCVQACVRIRKYFTSPLDGLITTKPFLHIMYAALRTIISKVMTRSYLNELQQV